MHPQLILRLWAAVVAGQVGAALAGAAAPPGAVANLQVTPITLERLDLQWSPVEGAEGYNVYQGASKGFTPGDDNWVAATRTASYRRRELKPATTAYFQVRAVVGGKEGPAAEACGTTLHKDLALVVDGSRRTIEGDAFRITWDAGRGGEIVAIAQYDGAEWNSILEETLPGYTLRDREGADFALRHAAGAEVELIKDTPDEIVLRLAGRPQTAEGKRSSCEIVQTYRVFKEGVLFCDLEIRLPPGAVPMALGRAELGLRLSKRLSQGKFRWGYFNRDSWQLRSWILPTEVVAEKCMYPYVAADYGLGAASSFTNHVAVFVEDWRAIAGPKESAGCRFGASETGGTAFVWTLADGQARLKAPFTYRNRWGLGLGAMRKTSRLNLSASRGNNLIGARYYHVSPKQGHPRGASPDDWPWYVQPRFWSHPAPEDVYPSDETIDEAARLGANVFVMHQTWMRCGGSNNWPPADYTPQDAKELKRVVDRCHARQMRVGLYMRGTEAYALYMPYFEQFCKYDYDGLYVDWNGPFYYNMPAQGCFRPSETHFPGYDYFRYSKMLRKRVGENGFLIGHTGACPTLLALAVFDGYLPGEFAEQKARLLDSPEAHVYFGLGSCCGTMPISYTAPHEKAVAYAAGLGSCLQMERGVLWQIWRSVPMERAWLYNTPAENLGIIASNNSSFRSSVYKIDRDQVLVVTANLGPRAAATLRLDMPALGLTGSYGITELAGKDLASFAARPAGQTGDGVVQAGPLEQYEIRGFKLDRLRPGGSR